ncbi:MAG: RNA methyltransferase [Calditrichia bacterium]|jgi:tRNA G18 (ribose-2'-O)-methylase SpoU|nr:RNA methyltransferase [Calditrichia bacterium]
MRKLSYKEIFSSRPTLAELTTKDRFPFYVLCENIRSLYNVGSIFRTSDAIRLEKLYLTGYTGYPPRKEIDKTALGAVDSVEWEQFENPIEAARQIKKNNISIIALEHTSESIPYDKYEFKFPFCLLLGNEVEGLTDELIQEADASIEIPMFGLKQSLNVSVAFGVVMYHALAQFLGTRYS